MIPQQAVELCKLFEGFSSTPYICPAGYWTIGYGHLCKADHPPITREQGEELLRLDLSVAAADVARLCPRVYLESDGRIAAIVDFTYNLGGGRLRASTLRKRINEGRWGEVPQELRKWVYGGGRVLPGLVKRREAEAALV